MNRSKWKTRIVLPGALAATAVMAAMAPAQAADASTFTSNSAGKGIYWDSVDQVQACDVSIDSHGVIAYIQVKQSDGSWKTFPRVYDGKGADTCNGVTQDVVRESAAMTITACLVDGADDPTPSYCKTLSFSGA